MVALTWHKDEDKTYEYGVDHGVFYRKNAVGVVWNGLISVDESYVGGDKATHYFDGIKYHESVTNKDFQATIQAFYPPKGFGPCDGELEMVPGFILTKQRRELFDFSYRSKVSADEHYKIHLVYNATASRSKLVYASSGATETPTLYTWQVSTVPEPSMTAYPTAHLVVDSSKVSLAFLLQLEMMLYGTDDVDPRFPTQAEIKVLKDELDGGTPYSTGYGSVTGGTSMSPGLTIIDGGGAS